MARKNPHPELGELIYHESYDDGRLTFVDTYAKVDKFGNLQLQEMVDRYGEESSPGETISREKAIALRKFLNKHFRGRK